jgi:di/tricarboxylate transporter
LIALLVLVSVAWHFLLPFHHVTLVIGFGSGFYENRHVLRFGAVLTLLVFASVFLLYIPWWKLTGLM